MQEDYFERFLEKSFPLYEVNLVSKREKNKNPNNISALHVWWARRPLSSSRATNYAALIPAIDKNKQPEEWKEKQEFIVRLSQSDKEIIRKAQKDILDAYNNKKPRILDPFSGGGSIPLEAMRLGCKVYINDYNPVAVFINKCMLEYPSKFGKKLIKEVEKWSDWVYQEVKKDLNQYFQDSESFSSLPICFIWARTCRCNNKACGAEIPLIKRYWLANKKDSRKKVALYPHIRNEKIEFEIIGMGYKQFPKAFDPANGSIKRSRPKCLICKSEVANKDLIDQFKNNATGERLIAVIYLENTKSGKKYRVANENDMALFNRAKAELKKTYKNLKSQWNIEPIPNEKLVRVPLRIGCINLWVYNLDTWGKLFNDRQKLVHLKFIEKLKLAEKLMQKDRLDNAFIEAIISEIALMMSKFTSTANNICRWNNRAEGIAGKPDQASNIPMQWDYPETNPFSGVGGSFLNHRKMILKILHNLDFLDPPKAITKLSATSLPYENDFFDAIITDPPYYDNVPYSYLSDFFYVWLKRSIGHFHRDLFSSQLTPKEQEIVAYNNNPHPEKLFEGMLKKSFDEMYRVLRPNGIAIITYAHKSKTGWQSLINSLLSSGLVVTASWPIKTEREARKISINNAALTSSVYIIARKINKESSGSYQEIKVKLTKILPTELETLYKNGLKGLNFDIAAIGKAIEIFGNYDNIFNSQGEIIGANQLIQDVQEIITSYALSKLPKDTLSKYTKYYIQYRQNYNNTFQELNEANNLAKKIGFDLLSDTKYPDFFEVKEKKIKLLTPLQRKNYEKLLNSTEIIDKLHLILYYWKNRNLNTIINYFANNEQDVDTIFKVAFAILKVIDGDNEEKRLLNAFLAQEVNFMEKIRSKMNIP
ncbi:MAG: DUF1156 domain-containing protein [Promethearchaeota archaeon]